MAKYLYEVRLKPGSENFQIFLNNVDPLGAESTDYGSNRSLCVISSSDSAETLEWRCTVGFPSEAQDEVTVEEVTNTTLKAGNKHASYWNVLAIFANSSKDYPNLKSSFAKLARQKAKR
jgi:hypothetical protein